MKVFCLIVLAICLLLSCKKETAVLNESLATKTNGTLICLEDHWDPSGALNAGIPNIHLVYNNKVYFPQNANGNPPGDLKVKIYDGNSWDVKPSDVPAFTNYKNFAFTLGNKGYMASLVGSGSFYQYDFANNTWTQKADFPGVAEHAMATFTVGNKGYVVGGANEDFSGAVTQTWEYNPANNTWTQKANLPIGRFWSTGFSIGNKGYVVNGGIPFGYFNSLVEYDPAADTWSFKSSFPGTARIKTQVFVIDGITYAGGGTGQTGNFLEDFYKYSAANDSWTSIDNIALPNNANYTENFFAINSKGYVGWDGDNGPKLKRYTPRVCF